MDIELIHEFSDNHCDSCLRIGINGFKKQMIKKSAVEASQEMNEVLACDNGAFIEKRKNKRMVWCVGEHTHVWQSYVFTVQHCTLLIFFRSATENAREFCDV